MANKLVLTITGPDGARRQVVQENAENVIVGSGPAAAVKLEGDKVSATHCMLKLEGGGVTVIDLGSSVGTILGGAAIKQPTALKAGDVLVVGPYKLSLDGAAQPAAARPVPAGAFGRVARLFNEELPPEETPAPDDKMLEVALLWGDTIINVRHFDEKALVKAGGGPRNDFHVYSGQLGDSFALATCDGQRCTLSIPANAGLLLRRGSEERSREQLARDGALKPADGAVQAHSLAIELHDRVQINLENVAFLVRWVRPHKLVQTGTPFDFYFTKVLTTSGMAGMVLLAAIFMTDLNAESLSEDLFKNPQRFAKLVIKPPEKEKKKIKDLKVKEPPKTKVEDKYGQKTDEKHTGPRINANKREEDRKKVMNAGLLALLGGGDGSTANVFAPGGLGTGINQALGSLKDSGISDSHGVGGLGSRGTGPGGGGTGLGLGGLGTKGGGRGGMGGYGAIDLGGRGKGETRVVPGKTTVTGSCERTVIGKVINRHANEIRYCYEVELNKDPNLAGKVAVTFTIDPTGAVSDANIGQSTVNSNNVEQCILTRVRRWKFPEPKGGGVCVINYPWVFKAAGAGGDEEAE